VAECSTDLMFPMLADIYYGESSQGAYGELSTTWTKDKTIAGNFAPAGAKAKEELTVDINIMQESLLLGRSRSDLRFATNGDTYPLTLILITNIRTAQGNLIYFETTTDTDNPTIYEIATQQPFVNFFGDVEHHKFLLRRAENQGVL